MKGQLITPFSFSSHLVYVSCNNILHRNLIFIFFESFFSCYKARNIWMFRNSYWLVLFTEVICGNVLKQLKFTPYFSIIEIADIQSDIWLTT